MTDKVMIDTNVLVYSYDTADSAKQQRALDTLQYLTLHNRGALSTQVLAEFFVTATRKISPPLSIVDAATRIEHLLQVWTIFDVTAAVTLEAVRGVRRYQFSFWDAQIWAVARLNQVPIVLSEDFNSGATIEGVQFINPFAMTTPVETWLP